MYNIWQVAPIGYSHAFAFSEVTSGLYFAFQELGLPTGLLWFGENPPPNDLKTIVLGAHLAKELKPGSIIYNMEQINSGSVFVNEGYIKMLREFEVWDYSHRNIEELKKLGIEAKYCGVGYVSELTNIKSPENPEIDVLFYGSINERRMKICNELSKQCNVYVACDCYGEERDKLIARTKIILNIHFYPSKVFELVRVSYLLANKKCVVSEYGDDKQLESQFDDAVVFAPYDELVETCLRTLYSESWKTIGNDGYEIFSKMKQTDYLKAVL